MPSLLWIYLAFLLLIGSSHCEKFSETIDGRVYEVHNVKRNWFSARDTCRADGLQLIGKHSLDDKRPLKELMKTYDLNQVWIGATDLGHPLKWVWFDNGREVDSVFFRTNPKGHDKRNCVKMLRLQTVKTDWEADHCEDKHAFICESRY